MLSAEDKEILGKIHRVSLYILLAFDKVCRDHDLTYFLDSGTALGAVRHGGFIPWDDDVDVGMPRKDYERFLQIGQSCLPEDIFLQTRETDKAYKRYAAKLRLKGTILQEYDDLPYEQNGLFIDIFPFDNIPQYKCIARINVGVVRLLHYLVRVRWISTPKFNTKFRNMIGLLIKRIPESFIIRIEKLMMNLCRKYENQDTGYMTCFFWIMTLHNTYIFKTSKIFPVKNILFEGALVKIMNDPDYYLKILYGEYMKLPPEEMRNCHHIKGTVDFGKYA